jgi:hypothetical protein
VTAHGFEVFGPATLSTIVSTPKSHGRPEENGSCSVVMKSRPTAEPFLGKPGLITFA